MSMNSKPDSINKKDTIMEVYASNFISSIKQISSLLEEYNYIGMDTEFPGIVYSIDQSQFPSDLYYNSLKKNVDALKMIQLGITLANSKGEKPQGISTWQFNLCFDCEKDEYAKDSFGLLCAAGIDFDHLKTEGIPHDTFAEYLTVSGLVLNSNVHWISYHGCYDFAYLLKALLNSNLPYKEKAFTMELKQYFPNHYDLKILTQGNENFKGGLNRLAYNLSIERQGRTHQAGSDSLVTIQAFFKLISNGDIDKDNLEYDKNILYGIGEGADDSETLSYTQFNIGQYNNYSQYTNNNINNNLYNDSNSSHNQYNNCNVQSTYIGNRNISSNNNINNNSQHSQYINNQLFSLIKENIPYYQPKNKQSSLSTYQSQYNPKLFHPIQNKENNKVIGYSN